MADAGAIRAGRAFVEIFADDSKFTRTLDKSARRFKSWGDGITAIGGKLFGFGAALAAPLIASTKVFTSMGEELVRASARTNTSVESLSQLKYAGEQTGTAFDGLQKGLGKLSKVMVQAAEGSPEAKQAFDDLGLSIEDLSKMSAETRLGKIGDALNNIKSPDMRRSLVESLFGKGGAELIPLLATGSAGIDKLTAKARELGLVVSTDSARSAEEFSRKLDDLWQVIKMGAYTVGSILAPAVEGIVRSVTTSAIAASRWISQHRGIVTAAAALAVSLVGGGIAMMVFGTGLRTVGALLGGTASGIRLLGGAFRLASGGAGLILPMLRGIGTAAIFALNPFKLIPVLLGAGSAAISGIGTTLTAMGGALAAVFSPVVLLGAAIVGIAAYLLYTSGIAGKAFAIIKKSASEGAAFVGKVFGGMKNAISAGNFSLAAQILWTSIKLVFRQGIAEVQSAWQGLKSYLSSSWSDASSSVGQAWNSIIATLSDWGKIKAAAMGFLSWIGNKIGQVAGAISSFIKSVFEDVTGDQTEKIAKLKSELNGLNDQAAQEAGKSKDEDKKPSAPETPTGPTAEQKRESLAMEYREHNRQAAERDRDMLAQLQDQEATQSADAGSIPAALAKARRAMIEKLKARIPIEEDIAESGTETKAAGERERYNDKEGTAKRLKREYEERVIPVQRDMEEAESNLPHSPQAAVEANRTALLKPWHDALAKAKADFAKYAAAQKKESQSRIASQEAYTKSHEGNEIDAYGRAKDRANENRPLSYIDEARKTIADRKANASIDKQLAALTDKLAAASDPTDMATIAGRIAQLKDTRGKDPQAAAREFAQSKGFDADDAQDGLTQAMKHAATGSFSSSNLNEIHGGAGGAMEKVAANTKATTEAVKENGKQVAKAIKGAGGLVFG